MSLTAVTVPPPPAATMSPDRTEAEQGGGPATWIRRSPTFRARGGRPWQPPPRELFESAAGPSPGAPARVPTFLEQRRIDDTLRAMLRRALFQAFGREPTEGELDAQVRREFLELTRCFRDGFAPSVPSGPGPADAVGVRSVIVGTGPEAARRREAEVVARYAAAQGVPSLLEAVRWYQAHHGGLVAAPALPECVDEFLCVKRAEGRAPVTLGGYRSKLQRFAEFFRPLRPGEVTAHDLGRFIAAAGHPTTRHDWWQTLNTFYAWCRRMRYVVHNPLPSALNRPISVPGSALVLTPAEARSILRLVRGTDQLGFWVLSLFAGLRTEELRRLQGHSQRWSIVRLRSGVIDLPRGVAKTDARLVPILPVLRPWLELVRADDGPFFAPNHFLKCRRVRNQVLEERCAPLTARHEAAQPGVRPPLWAFNIARRSYISYRLAGADASYVEMAREVGNSESMIRRHYARHVSRRAAREYFALTPDRI